MTCQSCIDKWTRYYKNKGFSHRQAHKMAKKLVNRLEKRIQKEKIEYIPLYLLENGRGITFLYGGIPLYRRVQIKLHNLLYHWIFLSNWKATLLWSFRRLQPTWIGRSYNPDYTQNCSGICTQPQSCLSYGGECFGGADCNYGAAGGCPMGTCACPAPLPNSTQSANNCTCNANAGECNTCSKSVCADKSYLCTCAGTCGYTCDLGYTWNGVACVAAGGTVLPVFFHHLKSMNNAHVTD